MVLSALFECIVEEYFNLVILFSQVGAHVYARASAKGKRIQVTSNNAFSKCAVHFIRLYGWHGSLLDINSWLFYFSPIL